MGDSKGNWRGWVRLAAGTAISIALIFFLTRGVSWQSIRENIAALPWWSVLLSGGIVMLSLPLRACQWYWLLGAHDGLTWMKTLHAICLGHAGNLVLPMRGGELVKAGVLARSAAMPVDRVLTSVVLCRLQDLIPITVIFLLFALSVDLYQIEERLGLHAGALASTGSLRAFGGLALAFALLGLAVFVLGVIAFNQNRARMAALRQRDGLAGRVADWGAARAAQIVRAVRVAGHPSRFLLALAAASGCWVLFTLASLPLLMGLGIPWGTGLYAALAITGATTFFQMLPSAPMAVGTFHAGCTMALLWVLPELGDANALSLAFVLHGAGALAPALPALLWFLSGLRVK